MVPNCYYEPELDINGTIEEQYVLARNGYITNEKTLTRLAELAAAEAEYDNENPKLYGISKKLSYLAQDAAIANEPHAVSVARLKYEYLENGSASTEYKDGNIDISITIDTSGTVLIAGTESHKICQFSFGVTFPFGEFCAMSQEDFEHYFNGAVYSQLYQEPELLPDQDIAEYATEHGVRHTKKFINAVYDACITNHDVTLDEVLATYSEPIITDTSDHIKVDGHRGSWYVIDSRNYDGKSLFLLEHETYGDEAACVIVDCDGKLVLEDVWNGFGDYEEQMDYRN